MNHVNLLPPKIEQYKQARKHKTAMVIAQILIVLATTAVVLYLQNVAQRARDESYELARLIAAMENERLYSATPYDIAWNISKYYEDFLRQNLPVPFDARWIAAILENCPPGATLTQLNYSPPGITLVGKVEAMGDAYAYRLNLMDAQVFNDVLLERVFTQPNGLFGYEILVLVGEYEK